LDLISGGEIVLWRDVYPALISVSNVWGESGIMTGVY
jgi:hypothetical protein